MRAKDRTHVNSFFQVVLYPGDRINMKLEVVVGHVSLLHLTAPYRESNHVGYTFHGLPEIPGLKV